MTKRPNWLAYTVISLAVIIVGVWVGYLVFYQPSADISASYIEVFQEIDTKHITSLNIDCIDHKLVFLPSSDDKIKITYFQKSDNSITYTTSSNSVSLKMVERCEDLDNLFYQSKRKIDTITVHIPENAQVDVYLTTVDGTTVVSDIVLKSFHFSSVNGTCDANYINIDKISLVSNYGNISIRNSWFEELNIGQVTGTTTVSLLDALDSYDLNIVNSYGNLWVNQQRVYQNSEDQSVIVNSLVLQTGQSKKISINGIRNTIHLNSTEKTEEPKEGQE